MPSLATMTVWLIAAATAVGTVAFSGAIAFELIRGEGFVTAVTTSSLHALTSSGSVYVAAGLAATIAILRRRAKKPEPSLLSPATESA